MLNFCLHSLFHEYGADFLKRVALRHPVRLMRALRVSAGLGEDQSTPYEVPPGGPESGELTVGDSTIVGLGFCLKPMDPPCISGRPNHDCHYFENRYGLEDSNLPACCEECVIRKIGEKALEAGASFYIMTSARDILFDVYLPSLDDHRFETGVFALCRYSIRPFSVPLITAGFRAWLFPYERGDCTDYGTWLLADQGIKKEQTNLMEEDLKAICDLLEASVESDSSGVEPERRGNIYYPILTSASAGRSER